VRTDDPRRYVVACAGAPACGSAALATRQLAPDIARLAAPFLDGSATIHVSGCPKGCAHSGAAALTLAGPDRLIVQGRAGDTPHGTISAANFIAGLRRLRAERELPLAALVREADFISRLGAIPVQPVDGGSR
jgi:precorrin-3B synthase